jgi:hypothetical protein
MSDSGLTPRRSRNGYEIARLLSCLPDEPRYVGDQDVFSLQDKVIEHILAADRQAEARAAATTAVDPIQQTVTEEIKDAIRRRTVERDKAKKCISFLSQPMGRAVHVKLKGAHESWKLSQDDARLIENVLDLSQQFGKQVRAEGKPGETLVPRRLGIDLF